MPLMDPSISSAILYTLVKAAKDNQRRDREKSAHREGEAGAAGKTIVLALVVHTARDPTQTQTPAHTFEA